MAAAPHPAPAGTTPSGTAPDVPDQLRAAAQALGLALDDTAVDRLCAYLALLQRWNRVHNLTAPRDPAETAALLDVITSPGGLVLKGEADQPPRAYTSRW